jgi:hypothetical protein
VIADDSGAMIGRVFVLWRQDLYLEPKGVQRTQKCGVKRDERKQRPSIEKVKVGIFDMSLQNLFALAAFVSTNPAAPCERPLTIVV